MITKMKKPTRTFMAKYLLLVSMMVLMAGVGMQSATAAQKNPKSTQVKQRTVITTYDHVTGKKKTRRQVRRFEVPVQDAAYSVDGKVGSDAVSVPIPVVIHAMVPNLNPDAKLRIVSQSLSRNINDPYEFAHTVNISTDSMNEYSESATGFTVTIQSNGKHASHHVPLSLPQRVTQDDSLKINEIFPLRSYHVIEGDSISREIVYITRLSQDEQTRRVTDKQRYSTGMTGAELVKERGEDGYVLDYIKEVDPGFIVEGARLEDRPLLYIDNHPIAPMEYVANIRNSQVATVAILKGDAALGLNKQAKRGLLIIDRINGGKPVGQTITSDQLKKHKNQSVADILAKADEYFDLSKKNAENMPLFWINNNTPFSINNDTKSSLEYFQNLSVEEIESITLLKGHSAESMYGQRGLNGVVMITKKFILMPPPGSIDQIVINGKLLNAGNLWQNNR